MVTEERVRSILGERFSIYSEDFRKACKAVRVILEEERAGKPTPRECNEWLEKQLRGTGHLAYADRVRELLDENASLLHLAGVKVQPAPLEPGRAPELEATRAHAAYWEEGARQLAKEGKPLEEVMQCWMQATFAWRNAAYAMWERIARHKASDPWAHCEHRVGEARYDHMICANCGAIKTDGGWGIASGKWFPSMDAAKFYKENGRMPDPLPAGGPTDSQRMDWMEANLCRAGEVREQRGGPVVKLCRVWSIMGEVATLREAVDGAMQAGYKPAPGRADG